MLKLYNSLSRKIEEVQSTNNVVTMYSCGPTVYYFAHIGNMRAYLFMDQVRRVLAYNGKAVNGVMNITDVGHLTSDADSGDDKMLLASKRESKTPWEIAKQYELKFLEDAKKLHISIPNIVARATEHIQEMIEFVQNLIEGGHAYETQSGVYFNVESFKEYGALSKVDINKKMAGARIEVDSEKKHPADFALWIKAPKNHIMQWESPWGMGYPGWHIECSAMGIKYLGQKINLHTGGIDHLPVHHENEIAQNNCFANKEVVQMWSHVAFLNVDGGKMSKSLGNLHTIADLEEKGYSPLDYRFFNFTANYRKPINFTFEALDSARTSRIKLSKLALAHKNGENECSDETIQKWETEFLNAINDDLNFPLAVSIVWEVAKSTPCKKIFKLLQKFDQVLAIDLGVDSKDESLPQEISELAEKRKKARIEKNWKESDELRNEIENKGFSVKDTPNGMEITKK